MRNQLAGRSTNGATFSVDAEQKAPAQPRENRADRPVTRGTGTLLWVWVILSIMALTRGQAAAYPASLPVYQVVQAGASPSQAASLAAQMNIPESLLVQTNGLVSFIDPTNWLFVPTVPVTDPVATNNLLAMTKKPISSVSIKFEAIDFGALSTQSVLDTNSALAAAASALAASGLTPQFGTPAITHTVFKAVFTNSDKTVSSVSNYLDTRVAYTFCDPAGYPMIGPGAQVQITYGASGNVTRLRYATCQMATGPSVSVITATEASNRIARLFAPGSQIDLRLVYWCPDFLPPTACPGCPPPAWNPTNILPWYVFNVTTLITNPITGIVSTNTSGFQRIPATDDVNFVPSVALSAWGGPPPMSLPAPR